MPAQVTQCPKCYTSFRVTEAQLQIANGAVRCGSCLHIFNATEHWLDGSTKAPEPSPAPEPSTSPAEEDALLDDIPEDLLEADQAGSEASQDTMDFSEELLSISDDDDDLVDLPSMPDALKSLDDQPEPVMNATIEQRALSDIFETDDLKPEPASLFDDDDQQQPADDSLFDEVDDDLLNDEVLSALSDLADGNDEELGDDFQVPDDLETSTEGEVAVEDDDNDLRFNDTAQHPAIDESSIAGDDEDDESRLFSDNREEDDQDDEPSDNTGDFSESFLDMDEWEDDQERVFKDLDELGDDETSQKEEDWARKLLEDDDEEEPAAEPDAPVAEEDPFEDLFGSNDDAAEDELDPELLDILNDRDEDSSHPVVEEEFVLGDEPMIAGERIGDEKLAMLANIEPEPVVFVGGSDRAKWVRRAWSAAAFLAVIALGIQHVAFNFERLARNDSYRGSLGAVCGLLGCQLPERDDIRQIRSTNLIVRSHPKVKDALVVDAILTNRATFKQGFPDLELLFSNLSGDVVAGRRFKPEEYLQGELSGMTTMPIQQPVHISLEIVDPGKDAVNYQLHFLPAKNS